MATANHTRTSIILSFEVGMDENGKPQLKRVTLPRVRYDITEDEISQFSLALASLSKHSLHEVNRAVYHEIIL